MDKFSDISNNNTQRDNLIQKVVSESGLSTEKVTELFESYSLMHGGDLKRINESFVELLNPNISGFDFGKFQSDIFDFASQISSGNLTTEQREDITTNLLQYIEKTCDIIVDVPRLLEIVCYVLILKNQKFEETAGKIGFGKVVKKLFENDGINILKINVDATNSTEINKINAKEDIKFYDGLKYLLARNNGRWGYNHHLDNAFQAIQDYLTNQIEELVNYDNVVSIDSSFQKQFLTELLKTKQLNPMYRNINSLRTLVSDIQTLVFDLMIIADNHITRDSYRLQYLNRENLFDYYQSRDMFVSKILSSSKRSILAYENSEQSKLETPCDEFVVWSDNEIDIKMRINQEFVDVWKYGINTKVALDALHIIKACETEFSLPLRKMLNQYITKSVNLVVNLEKINLQANKVNKYKTF